MTRELRRIPLLRDRHTHPFLYAALHEGVNLNEEDADRTGSRDELRNRALRRIHEHAQRGIPGWAIAHGWNNGLYSLSKEDFDDLPFPLVVFNLSLHTLIVNDAGRSLLQQEVADVGANLDDQQWIERNVQSVLNVFANAGASAGRLQRYFQWLLEECGVYYAEEMVLVDGNELRFFEEAAITKRTRFWAEPDQYDRLPRPIQEKIHGIKLFTDGALGAWTAALHQSYRDHGGFGMLMYERGELERLLKRYLDIGKPIALHAIGDRAIDRVVSAVEAVGRPARSEIRIEHAQLISEPTAKRAKELGITLCMQPNFSEDSANYAERLPEGYPERNNPFRMLIDRVGYVPGVDLLFGSDGMPHGWRYGLKQSLFPKGGYPGQTLTVDEFVAGYCLPDCGAGHIEVEIDRDNRQVAGRVVLG
jgi:predicted amidohydrolase YtcJ